MFKNLKSGDHLFMINTSDDFHIDDAYVCSIDAPRYVSIAGKNVLTIDITLEWDDKTKKKVFSIPESSIVSYSDMYILCSTKESMVSELHSLKKKSEEYVDLCRKHEKRMLTIDDLLNEYDEEYKKKNESEKRMDKMESAINDIRNLLMQSLSLQKN